MPVVQTHARVRNLVIPVIPTDEYQLIYTPIPWSPDSISAYALLKTLNIRADVKSLDEISVPNFEQPSNQMDRYTKMRDNAWRKARYQFDLCMRMAGGEWREYISVAIQNHESVPYTSQPLLEYMSDGLAYGISEGVELGVRFRDVGYGLPALTDKFTIFGELHEEMKVEVGVISTCTALRFPVSSSSVVLHPADSDRKQLLLVNAGEVDVWASRSGTATVGAGLYIAPGGSMTIEGYYGEVSAVAEEPALLSGEVCY